MPTSIPTYKTTLQYHRGHMKKLHIAVNQPLVTLKPAEMKELRHVMPRFGASSVELLVLMLIVMTMLISVQGGDAERVHDHHRDSYKSLGPYFYHDIVNGTNVTDLIVVGGRGGTGFGTLTVFDDPLTDTPEINSTTVARSQGLQVVVRFSSALNFMTLNLRRRAHLSYICSTTLAVCALDSMIEMHATNQFDISYRSSEYRCL